jgi:hypothetical protein
MTLSRAVLFSLSCTPLLGGCAGMETYAVHAESERPNCSQTEGYPDCSDGYRVNAGAHELLFDRASGEVVQRRYE